MSALHQLPKSPPQRTRAQGSGVRRPGSVRRVHPELRRQQQQKFHRTIALETGIKMMTNLGISAIAVATLTHLLPYRSAQQAKLVELQQEVAQVEHRVSAAKSQFEQAFDPSQVKEILKQQTAMTDPSERQIVIDDRIASPDQKSAQLPD
jgi:hypothetical protein